MTRRPGHILVVDDNPHDLKLIEVLLTRAGFGVTCAASGEQALETVRETAPDVILLDVLMRGLDGYEVCRRLKADPLTQTIPIVMVTALDERSDKLRALDIGASEFLTKPVDRAELVARVRTLLQVKKLHDELAASNAGQRRLVAELTQTVDRLKGLGEVSLAISSNLNLGEVLTSIVTLAVQLSGADDGIIREYDSATDLLTYRASYGLSEKAADHLHRLARTESDRSTGIVSYVVGTRQLVQVGDIEATGPDDIARLDQLGVTGKLEALRPLGIRAILALPLMGEELLGVLIMHRKTPGEFPPETINLLQAFAAHSSMAIQNARLFERLQQERTAIERERQTLSAIMAGMSDGLVVADPAGRIRYCNLKASEFVAADSSSMVGSPIEEFLLSSCNTLEKPAAAVARLKTALAHVSDRPTFELTFSGPPRRDLLALVFPITGIPGDGSDTGVLLHDVTRAHDLARARDEDAARQEALLSLSQALAQETSVAAIAEQLRRKLNPVVPTSSWALLLLEPDGDLEVVAAGGAEASGRSGQRLPADSSIAGRALRLAAPVVVDDVSRDPGYIPLRPGVRSVMVIPLRHEQHDLGVFSLEWDEVGSCTRRQVALAQIVAADVGLALARAQLVDRLTESETRHRLIIDGALDAVLTMDASGAITGWNAQAQAMFGWTLQEALGRRVDTTIMPARYREAHRRGLERYLATGEPRVLNQRLELTAINRDGHEFPVDLAITAVQRDDRPSFTAFIRDISERKCAEQQLQEALEAVDHERATLAGILASMSQGVIMVQPDNNVSYCSVRAGALLGLDPDRVVGRPVNEMIDHARLASNLDVKSLPDWEQLRTAAPGSPGFELSLPGPPRRDLSLDVIVVAAEGAQSGVLLNDVTHERELARTKDELLSVVSHELRTPLASLVGFAELLLSRDYSEDQRREFLNVMYEEGRRLTGLITDFLDLQRMESGRQSVHLQHVPIGPVLERAVATVGEDDMWPMVIDVPDDLPCVEADPDRLHQVLVNLLSNARKYSPDGGEIRLVASRSRRGAVKVTVMDHGLGLPAEALPKLFEKFYRVDNSDRRSITGTGLGLAICRQIIAEHGGSMRAESPGLGLGSSFLFTLPVAKVNPEAGDVLIVEDDPGFARLLEAELATMGLSAIRVASAEAALDQLDVAPPRALALDLLLPGLSGEELLERLTAQGGKPIPVVVATVKDLSQVEQEHLASMGVVAILPKGAETAASAAKALAGACAGQQRTDRAPGRLARKTQVAEAV